MDNPGFDARTLRYLKWLVTGLTVTMIAGFITIVVLFAMRFSDMRTVALPDSVTLPDGAVATAFTRGDDWFAVVTEDSEILIYSAVTGNLRQRIRVED
jgi:hypothetical protein